MRRQILVIACTVIWLGASGGEGRAQEPLAPGDTEAGKVVAAKCVACHGSDGIGREPGIPHLAGQKVDYIHAGLTRYKTGDGKDERMNQAVAGLTDADAINLAAYYASLKPFNERPAEPGAEAAAATEADPFAAVREATAGCAGCHGEDGNSDIPGTPSLAGQHVAALINSMQAYKEGTRVEPMMQAFAEPLTRSDIEDMAYFYAAMEPRRSAIPPEGDRFAGMAVTAPCAGCHGRDGNSGDPKTPRLAGLDAGYLIAAVNAYKAGSREHSVMRDAVATLRDQDIKDLAAFYTAQEPKALPIRKPLTIAEWTDRCGRCHGPNGNSSDERFPILAGQDETYLIRAMKLFHGGERANEMMYAMSFLMSGSDIRNLAAYYARQRKQ
jgi:cytochrome c553